MEIKAQRDRGVYLVDIAADRGVHPKTISRALQRGGPPDRKRRRRASKLDPYRDRVDALLRDGIWNCVVILREIQAAGYGGGITVLRSYVHDKRPLRQSRATVRFETEPAKQLQNDWGELDVEIAGQMQRVYFSANILGYSRGFHFWCGPSKDAEHTYEGLIRSFEYFGGVPLQVLVDNQGPLVLSHRRPHDVRYHERFLDLACLYGFTPAACRPARAQTKGKVERIVLYIKDHFFQRYRSFDSWAHLNAMAERWLREEAELRIHGTHGEVVRERLRRELPQLGALPDARFDTSYREQRIVGWDGYIDVRGNRYSVPAHLCGQPVTVRIGLDQRLRVFAGDDMVCDHVLRDHAAGWSVVPGHHAPLWRNTLAVEQRDLSTYAEVAGCS